MDRLRSATSPVGVSAFRVALPDKVSVLYGMNILLSATDGAIRLAIVDIKPRRPG